MLQSVRARQHDSAFHTCRATPLVFVRALLAGCTHSAVRASVPSLAKARLRSRAGHKTLCARVTRTRRTRGTADQFLERVGQTRGAPLSGEPCITHASGSQRLGCQSLRPRVGHAFSARRRALLCFERACCTRSAVRTSMACIALTSVVPHLFLSHPGQARNTTGTIQ